MRLNLNKKTFAIAGLIFLGLFVFGLRQAKAIISPFGTVNIFNVTNADDGTVNRDDNKSDQVNVFYQYSSSGSIIGIKYFIDNNQVNSPTVPGGDLGTLSENPGRFAAGYPYGTHNLLIMLLIDNGAEQRWITSNTVTYYTEDPNPPYAYPTPSTVYGCTDPSATNYNSSANSNDGSCIYACTSGPSGYTKCADENGTCSFSGTGDVAYGCSGSYNLKTNVNSSISCNNATFGDPVPGVAKACFWKTSPVYATPYATPYPTPYPTPYETPYSYPTPAPAAFNDASIVSYNVPSSVTVGQSFAVSITMKNTGNTTWKVVTTGNREGDYNLGAYDNTWGWARQSVGSDIAPGSNKTFSWTATAPSTPGTYSFAWRMVDEWVEWFGPQFSVPITVNTAYSYPYEYQYPTPIEDIPPCTSGPSGYTKCADENGTCSFSGTGDVAYGCSGSYNIRNSVVNSISCNNATFGDPLVGVLKACFWKPVDVPPPPPPPPFEYTLSKPANVSVTKGGIDQYGQTTVTRTLTSGTTESVDLSLSGVPAGVSYSISSDPCSPTCSSTILFTVSPSANPGTYTITVTGTPLSHSQTFTLTIVASSAIISSCTPSDSTPVLNSLVTWSASVQGGQPPYTYSWTGTNVPTAPAPSTQSFNITYSTIGTKTATVHITDSLSNTGVCTPAGTANVSFDPKFEEI
jgi:hypothetical protein